VNKNFLTSLICTSLIICPVYSQKKSLTIDKAIDQLKDLSYEKRENASNFLWENASIEELETLNKDPDPEVRVRAKILIQNLRTGLTPETSKDVVKMIHQFNESPADRLSLFKKLRERKAYLPLLTSISYLEEEENPLNIQLKKNGDKILAEAIEYYNSKEGNPLLAIRLLELSPTSPRNSRLWAFLKQQQGQEHDSLEYLTNLPEQTEKTKSRVLALYRSMGDKEGALEWAKEHQLDDFLVGQSMLDGDLTGFINWWSNKYDKSNILESYLSALKARHEGKIEDSAPFIEALLILSEQGAQSKNNALFLLSALGEFNQSLNLMDDQLKSILLNLRGDFKPQFELTGLKYGEPITEEWVKENVIDADFKDLEQGYGKLDRYITLLNQVGDLESLHQIIVPAWNSFESNTEKEYAFLERLWESGGMSSVTKLLNELSEKKTSTLIEHVKETNPFTTYLYETAKETFPKKKEWELLDLSFAIISQDLIGEQKLQESQEIIKTVEKKCSENPKDLLQERYLATLYNIMGYYEKVLSYRELLYKKKPSVATAWDVINLQTYLDQYQEAAKLSQSIDDNTESITNYSLKKIALLEKAGFQNESEELIQLYSKHTYNDPLIFNALATQYTDMQILDKASLSLEKSFLLGDFSENSGKVWGTLLKSGKDIFAKKKDYHRAALCTEVYLLTLLSDLFYAKNPSSAVDMQAIRLEADIYWIQHYATSGNDTSARNIARHIAKEWNGNPSLADSFYPALRSAGYMDILEESLEGSLQSYRNLFVKYPNAHNQKNSAAWLASRAALQVDEAKTYIEEALSHSPNNSAYLDTMAEILFALGDRKNALKYSLKAWQQSSNNQDPLIKSQYYHFKNDPLPNK